jgi:NitT/TauT family transport system substrate-binding protein
MPKTARFVAFAAAAILGLAACGSSNSVSGKPDTTKTTLALNFSPSGLDLPVYAALEKGYYEDEGLDLDLLITKSSQDAINAVTSKRADIGTATLPYLALSESQGVNTLSVGNRIGTHAFGLFVPKDGGSTDLTDLENKTILAASAGVIEETKGLLVDNGVDVSKVNFATIAPSSLLTSYSGGQGDALVTSLPFGGPAVQPSRPSHEISFSDLGAKIPDYTYFVLPGTEKTNAGTIKAFLRATYRGLQDALDDPDAAVAGMAKQVQGLNPDTTVAQWKATLPFLCTVGVSKGSSVGKLDEETWASAGQIMKDLGITPTLVDTGSMITNEFTGDITEITCPIPGS